MDLAISILSGGLDSAVCTAIARGYHDVKMAITFDYGQRAAKREIEASSHLCKEWNIKHKIVDLKILAEIGKSALLDPSMSLPNINETDLETDGLATLTSAEQVWVPNRNSIFINIAAAMAEARGFQWLLTGFNKEEAATFPDNSIRFINAINTCLTESTLTNPQVISYVKEMDKINILETAIKMDIKIEKLWCCYEGKEKWCGRCESCARTIRAMKKLNVFKNYKSLFLPPES